jgi:hypothetical protein
MGSLQMQLELDYCQRTFPAAWLPLISQCRKAVLLPGSGQPRVSQTAGTAPALPRLLFASFFSQIEIRFL